MADMIENPLGTASRPTAVLLSVTAVDMEGAVRIEPDVMMRDHSA